MDRSGPAGIPAGPRFDQTYCGVYLLSILWRFLENEGDIAWEIRSGCFSWLPRAPA